MGHSCKENKDFFYYLRNNVGAEGSTPDVSNVSISTEYGEWCILTLGFLTDIFEIYREKKENIYDIMICNKKI